MLEIGVKNGGSLALWNRAFMCEIVGIDKEDALTQDSRTHLFEHVKNVSVHKIEVPSPKLSELGTFDLIIDDGSHKYEDIIGTFEVLWPKVLDAGFYVIEDWRTDAGRPWDLLWNLAKRMIGYWPDENPPQGCCEKGVPYSIMAWRDLLVVRKGPHE